MTIEQLVKKIEQVTGNNITYNEEGYLKDNSCYINNGRAFHLVRKEDLELININSFEGMKYVNNLIRFLV